MIENGFIDIGSKFHKIQRMTSKSFKAIRAPLDDLDASYLLSHVAQTGITVVNTPVSGMSAYP